MSAKFFQSNGNWLGVALVWSQDHKRCALMGITLANMSWQLIVSEEAPNFKNLFTLMECTDNLLFISNMNCQISIYQLPTFVKVGSMLFNNQIENMLIAKTKQANITIANLLVLEKMEVNKPGSLQIYVLSE